MRQPSKWSKNNIWSSQDNPKCYQGLNDIYLKYRFEQQHYNGDQGIITVKKDLLQWNLITIKSQLSISLSIMLDILFHFTIDNLILHEVSATFLYSFCVNALTSFYSTHGVVVVSFVSGIESLQLFLKFSFFNYFTHTCK